MPLLSVRRWQRRVRWLIVLVQAAVVLVERGEGDAAIASGTVLLVLLVGTDVWWSRRARAEPRTLFASNLTILTLMTLSWGEAHGPLHVFFLVEIALAASSLARREALTVAALAVVLQAIAYVAPALIHPPIEVLHDLTHAASAMLAAAVLTAVLVGLSEGARVQAAALREASATREHAGRLAAIGRLAAGVAHELGTPLGSIELLAEEVGDQLPDGSPGHGLLSTLQGEVRRCRRIVDRLLARGEPERATTDDAAAQIRVWLGAWGRGHEDALRIEVDPTCEGRTVRGGQDGWRGALWTVLDNARRASSEPIAVSVTSMTSGMLVEVEDRGPGLADEALARAGEPFWSQWPSQPGAGLGLYVARTFARGAGGDVRLERRKGGGVRAILSLPFEEAV